MWPRDSGNIAFASDSFDGGTCFFWTTDLLVQALVRVHVSLGQPLAPNREGKSGILRYAPRQAQDIEWSSGMRRMPRWARSHKTNCDPHSCFQCAISPPEFDFPNPFSGPKRFLFDMLIPLSPVAVAPPVFRLASLGFCGCSFPLSAKNGLPGVNWRSILFE